jgi:hypothetical protein
MSEGIEKLERDLVVLEAMVAEMPDYLRSDVLFWRMARGGMPMLTLGGYLMRQHRLQALADLLDEEEKERLDTAVLAFNASTQEKIVRLEEKAHTELEARIRQWAEALKDLNSTTSLSHYRTVVETRVMIAALIDKLQTSPYQLQSRIISQVNMLDSNLGNHWQSGDFVWPPEWQPAYPKLIYWWLHGKPR